MTWRSLKKLNEELSLIESAERELQEKRTQFQLPRPTDPVKWTQTTRILKGLPFSFNQRPYLLPIYRDKHRRIVVAKARQLEMTEWAVNWLLHNLTTYPFTIAIYAAPRMDQTSRFSRDRFRRAILDAPKLRDIISRVRELEDDVPAISRVPFSNGSLCYLLSAWGDFGAIRNIPADFVVVDEAQDIQAEALPVIEEAMSHSKFRREIIIGTASDAGSQFDQLWNQSDMNEWDEESQAWVAQKPENQFYSGYHIDQRMAPWIRDLPPTDPDSIEGKRARYSERRFMNEVLGLFYRGLAKPLLTEDMLACRDFNLGFMHGLAPPHVSYAGVDWGGGQFAFTVMWIMLKQPDGRLRTLFVHKFVERDQMKQVNIIAELVRLFNVRQMVADIGYGAVQVSELQKKFGSRVFGCQYVRRPEIPLERKVTEEYGERVAQMMVLADRSFWIETAIDHIKHKDENGAVNPRLILPWAEPKDVEWIVDHFTCIEMEEEETVSGKKYHHYTHPEGQPDDALHAFIYALIAESVERISGPAVIKELF